MPSQKQHRRGSAWEGSHASLELKVHMAAAQICFIEPEHYVSDHRSQPTRLGSPSTAKTSPALNTPHTPQPLIISLLLFSRHTSTFSHLIFLKIHLCLKTQLNCYLLHQGFPNSHQLEFLPVFASKAALPWHFLYPAL